MNAFIFELHAHSSKPIKPLPDAIVVRKNTCSSWLSKARNYTVKKGLARNPRINLQLQTITNYIIKQDSTEMLGVWALLYCPIHSQTWTRRVSPITCLWGCVLASDNSTPSHPSYKPPFSQPSKCRLHNEIPDTYTVIGLWRIHFVFR